MSKRPGEDYSGIVNKALSAFFSQQNGIHQEGALLRRLDRMTRQTETLKRNQIITSEAFALFVRYFLTVIPPVPDSDKASAQAQGASRFERYLESLQTVLAGGERVLFNALEDAIADESAFFTKEELMRLDEPAPEKEPVNA